MSKAINDTDRYTVTTSAIQDLVGKVKAEDAKKVDIENVSLQGQTTTILEQVKAMGSANVHYRRFYTKTDAGANNISDAPGGAGKGFAVEAYCNRYNTASDYRYVVIGYPQSEKPKIAWVANATTALSWSALDTDTHWTSHLYAGSGTAANAATTNGNTKLTAVDNSTVRNTVTIQGSNNVSVSSDANGVITIDGSHNHDAVYMKATAGTKNLSSNTETTIGTVNGSDVKLKMPVIPGASSTTPIVDGTASKGSESSWARGDHVHPTDTSREAASNKKTTINATSDTEFPTSKAVATFVNSSIATATANFLGTYDVVADLGLTTSATNAQIATALGSHTWPTGVTPTNNDYVFVSVDDPGTTTASAEYRRFKYDGSAWSYEYTLNNSSFTQAQWDAINSGVTASFVTNAVTGVKGNAESSYRTGQVNLTAANIGASASDHTHGNIANGGTLTDTAAAAAGNDYVVIRDADNSKIQTSTIKGTDVADAVSKKHSHSTLTLSTTAQAYDGSHTLALPSSDPYTSARTPASHTHGNITNGGALQTNDITIANGDKLVVTDSSDSNKVARTSVSFDGSTTTKALTPKGTFEAFAKSGDITSAIQALDVSSVGGDGKYIAAISETDGKISATATTMDTTPTASSTKAVTSGGIKTAIDAKADKVSITGATKCKITYNSQGIVTAGDNLAESDIPTLNWNKLWNTTLAFHRDLDRGADSGDNKKWSKILTKTVTNYATNSVWGVSTVIYDVYNNGYGTPYIPYIGTLELKLKWGHSAGSGYSLKTSGSKYARWIKWNSSFMATTDPLTASDRTGQNQTGGIYVKVLAVSDDTVEWWIYNNIWDTAVLLYPRYYSNAAPLAYSASNTKMSDELIDYISTTGATVTNYTVGDGAFINYSLASNYPRGFTSYSTAQANWGKLKDSTLYAPVTKWNVNDCEIAFAQDKSVPSGHPNKTLSVQVDGYFYQNEGNYRVLDTSDVTSTYSSTGTAPVNGTAVASAISGKSDIYKWNAVTQGQKWSRIFYSESTAGVVGSSGILWIGCTRASVVCNAVFLVTAAHNGAERSNIVELSSCGYSELRCRLVVNSSANYYFEVYDTANSIASGTTQQWYCRYVPLRESKITTYTAFTDGTTIPSNYATCNDFTITVGNSAFAIKNITRSGTTFTATRQNGSTFTFTQQDNNHIPSAYCETAAGTAAKVASCTNYTATANTYLHVLMRYANSSAGALTLNVNSQGAKPIYINGAVSGSSNYTLPAGTYIAYYDGTNYWLRTDGILQAAITGTAGFADAVYTRTNQTGDGWFKLAETKLMPRTNSDNTAIWDVALAIAGGGIVYEKICLDVRFNSSGDGVVSRFVRTYEADWTGSVKFAVLVSGQGGSGNTQVQLWAWQNKSYRSISIRQAAGNNWSLAKYNNSVWTYYSGDTGGTSKPVADATNHISVTDSTNVHMRAASFISTGTLPVARGGTGMSTATNKNAVVIGNSTTVTDAMQTVRTGNGAFYATAQDAKPTFGTLPIDQGGTGATTRLNALKALTNESVGTNATYFLTITNSWGKGGYTSVADAKTVLGLGSAAYTASTDYAPSSTISCTTANVKTALGTGSGTAKYLREDGTWQTPVDSKVRITVDSSAATYKILATAASSPTTNTDSQAKYSASCTITGDGTMGAVKYNVNSKCTLQFDSTNDALDFVFA